MPCTAENVHIAAGALARAACHTDRATASVTVVRCATRKCDRTTDAARCCARSDRHAAGAAC
jgi:hypothetical protein